MRAWDWIALILGLSAVACFLLSYLQRRRDRILALNLTSRVLYVTQYLLLGAWEGAALDVAGALSAFLAQGRERRWMRRCRLLVLLGVNAAVIAVGLLLYRDLYSLLPLTGVLLQTDALWLKREKHIRLLSMVGCPFWFLYNLHSGAYGSCVGDGLAFLFLTVSLIRYDLLGKSTPPDGDDGAS